MVEPEKVDFKKIIAEILAVEISHRRKLSLYKLALMMHRDKKQIKRWMEGQDPRHYEGQMLLMIHAEYVSKKDTIIQEEKAEIATA